MYRQHGELTMTNWNNRTSSQAYRVQALRTLEQGAKQAGSRIATTLSQGSLEDPNAAVSGPNEENTAAQEQEPELGDADKLIQSFLHYTGREIITGNEKLFVERMAEKHETIVDRLLRVAARNLLLGDGWDNETDINTKLCLSNIANLISPQCSSFLETILTATQYALLESIEVHPFQGLSAECLAVFDELVMDR
ncbi:hypothetical protein BDB00DRAFT_793141 [Zychaea mexicana]|uniref:uncharacterized protein n=1 Tax=Zychaea mexicana TaxID=64656 RepID=UPI0022FF3F4D|nr:uncharacterized protein BDB00DRAFT_793141 [Zychaea mexicana]KAI9479631.1 hypothetical protein BDB00DRAFT_793141 [Zychaea mexicana]